MRTSEKWFPLTRLAVSKYRTVGIILAGILTSVEKPMLNDGIGLIYIAYGYTDRGNHRWPCSFREAWFDIGPFADSLFLFHIPSYGYKLQNGLLRTISFRRRC
jgi:hypothetical protein